MGPLSLQRPNQADPAHYHPTTHDWPTLINTRRSHPSVTPWTWVGRFPNLDAMQSISGNHSSHGTIFAADGGTEKLANLASPLEINPVIVVAESVSPMSNASRSSACLSSNQQPKSCSVDGNTSSAQHPTRRFATFERMFSAASIDPCGGRPWIFNR